MFSKSQRSNYKIKQFLGITLVLQHKIPFVKHMPKASFFSICSDKHIASISKLLALICPWATTAGAMLAIKEQEMITTQIENSMSGYVHF